MAKPNKLDNYINHVAASLNQVNGFDKLISTKAGMEYYMFIHSCIADVKVYKSLVYDYLLPAANRAKMDLITDINRSVYKKQLNFTNTQLNESYNDVLRHGYVVIFHKVEYFLDTLPGIAANLFEEVAIVDKKEVLVKYKDYFGKYANKDWKVSETIQRINWIANTVKHSNGIPEKKYMIEQFKHLPEGEKIVLTTKDWISDIDKLVEVYPVMVELCVAIVKGLSLSKVFHDDDSSSALLKLSTELEVSAAIQKAKYM